MVAVDRLEEFTELLKIKAESQTNETSTLRNRKTAAQNVKDQDGDNEKEFSPTVFTFSKSFLSECTLIVSVNVFDYPSHYLIFPFRTPRWFN